MRTSAIVAFSAVLLAAGLSQAATVNSNITDTESANVSATVVAPITLTKTSDLSFGTFTSDSAACTVAVSASNNQTVTGNCAPLSGSTISAAGFTVGGSGSRSFTTNVSATSPTLSDGAGHTMALTLQNNAPTHLTNGAATINIFGSLAVAANQAAGSYADTVNVTVSY